MQEKPVPPTKIPNETLVRIYYRAHWYTGIIVKGEPLYTAGQCGTHQYGWEYRVCIEWEANHTSLVWAEHYDVKPL